MMKAEQEERKIFKNETKVKLTFAFNRFLILEPGDITYGYVNILLPLLKNKWLEAFYCHNILN